MSRNNRWRTVASGIAPILGSVLLSGAALAGTGNGYCDTAPGCDSAYQAYPSAPIVTDSMPSDGSTEPLAPSPLSAPQFDPSAVFATNFGGGGVSSLAFADAPSVGGYIDTAIVRTMVRFRYDVADNFNRADRAEYYYTTWDTFGGENPNPPGVPDPNVDRQTMSFYLEYAFGADDDISLFVDMPIVFSNPQLNPTAEGIGDLQMGLKMSLYETRCQQLTFQLKNYIPTADNAKEWIGTGHYSIEPGLLYLRRFDNGLIFEGEITDWIPIGGAVNPNNGDDYQGNVLRYGAGLGYNIGEVCCNTVTPVIECVGWSVLSGQVFDFNRTPTPGPASASGDTIVNLKLGTRITNKRGGSLYAGWGHSLTGDRWYEDIFRIELRRMF